MNVDNSFSDEEDILDFRGINGEMFVIVLKEYEGLLCSFEGIFILCGVFGRDMFRSWEGS